MSVPVDKRPFKYFLACLMSFSKEYNEPIPKRKAEENVSRTKDKELQLSQFEKVTWVEFPLSLLFTSPQYRKLIGHAKEVKKKCL
ncbi:CLUMA_CG002421, isoform A [Clunio marinus]|uniref:CLUMA_CG002421, isoform A n=1 Tax=Clunio marinus TaxID=568069 RepID=A0A1J1HM79_9DIPT|nr:CLUMA_CG002421, isoform A [Clunio marinus]